MGRRHLHDARGGARPGDASHRPVSEHRAAGGLDHRELPRRLRGNRPELGRASDRAADERHRQPPLFFVREHEGRKHDDHADVPPGHEPGRGPGPGPEQALAGDPAPAAGGPAARDPRGEIHEEFPGRRGIRLHGRKPERRGPSGFRRVEHPGSDQPDAGSRGLPGVRRPIRHARLARSDEAHQLRAHTGGRAQRHRGPECAGRVRRDRRTPLGAGPADQCHRPRALAALDAGGVRKNPPARGPGRGTDPPQGCRGDQTRRGKFFCLREIQRRADLRHRDPSGDGGERADDSRGGAGHDEAAPAHVSARRGSRLSPRHRAVCRDLHPRGGQDAVRGHSPGLLRDVSVPAKFPRDADPDDRGAGGIAGDLRRAVRVRIFDQHADDVRDGAGDRAPGR